MERFPSHNSVYCNLHWLTSHSSTRDSWQQGEIRTFLTDCFEFDWQDESSVKSSSRTKHKMKTSCRLKRGRSSTSSRRSASEPVLFLYLHCSVNLFVHWRGELNKWLYTPLPFIQDCADAGWWMGEIGGRQGVFPDNFVKLLEVEKEVNIPMLEA